ncbi:hypothetical protein N7475_010488 [Penicillium sp. IBT 31633x]|nr:hypothetical protein N7475_010488 [Penicillium sp. IBT 31633x]
MSNIQSLSTQSPARRLFAGTRAILKYRRERDHLVDNIRTCINTLRQRPEGNHLIEVALNVHSLKTQADQLKRAAEAVAIDAKDMNYVVSRGVRYFNRTIPARCDEFGHDTRQMARVLRDHVHKPVVNTEHEISLDLQYALANLGFE